CGTPTERAAALAQTRLSRHGVVTRESVHAEEIAGGFAAVYPVLKAMEEAGRARRGYFVAGLGGAQFAVPGAEDRLRSFREAPAESSTLVLAATDPANPHGAVLPWPRVDGEGRAQRAAGAQVVLHDGGLVGWLGRWKRKTPEGDTIFRAATALRKALVGARVTRFRSNLSRAPVGERVEEVTARGKNLLVRFEKGRTLRTHMMLHGSWHIYREGERWRRPAFQARLELHADNGFVAVCFNAPVVEWLQPGAIADLGPDATTDAFDREEARRRLRRM